MNPEQLSRRPLVCSLVFALWAAGCGPEHSPRAEDAAALGADGALPAACANGRKDPSEADVDCGASCAQPCAEGRQCRVAGDCLSGRCAAGLCAPQQTHCAAEGDPLFCTRFAKACGQAKGADQCGDFRAVDCGICPGGSHCVTGRCSCPAESNAAFCQRHSKECGTFSANDNCGNARRADCGGCPPGGSCGVSAANRCSCQGEPDRQFCQRHGKSCGTFSAKDNCGVQRTLDCGSCLAPQRCAGGGVANICGPDCVPESDAEFCDRQRADCGVLVGSDNCGSPRKATCGVCSGKESCGGAGLLQHCGCARESDEAFCARLGKNCGEVSGDDSCGLARRVSCGVCSGYLSCGGGGQANRCGCQAESDKAFCARLEAGCGELLGIDNCGGPRSVAVCGSCVAPESCGGAGKPKHCGCSPESDVLFCRRVGAQCGAVSGIDNCSQARTVASCGGCTAPLECGKLGTPNRCEACSHQCPALGLSQCRDGSLYRCEAGASGCFKWSEAQPCPSGQCAAILGSCEPAPSAPRLVAPISSVRSTGQPVFSWVSAADADESLIQICLDRFCNNVVAELRGKTTAPLPMTLACGAYFWRGFGVKRLDSATEIRSLVASATWVLFSTGRAIHSLAQLELVSDFDADGEANLLVSSGDAFAMRGRMGAQSFSSAAESWLKGHAPQTSIHAGDTDGDGYPEFASIEYYTYDLGSHTIALFEYAASTGKYELAQKYQLPQRITGITGLGDVDGDGYADVLVTHAQPCSYSKVSSCYPDGLQAKLLYGGPKGLGSRVQEVSFPIYREGESVSLTPSFHGIGDFNGDGYADLAVFVQLGSDPAVDRVPPGYLLIYGGAAQAPLSHSMLRIDQVSSLKPLGDVNGDGYPDLYTLQSALPWHDDLPTGGYHLMITPGETRFHWGGRGPLWSMSKEAHVTMTLPNCQHTLNYGYEHEVAHAVVGATDINGDGFNDLLRVLSPAFGKWPCSVPRVFSWQLGAASGLSTTGGQVDIRDTKRSWSVHAADDSDGDGFGDVVVAYPVYRDTPSAPYEPGYSEVYRGTATGVSSSGPRISTYAQTVVQGF